MDSRQGDRQPRYLWLAEVTETPASYAFMVRRSVSFLLPTCFFPSLHLSAVMDASTRQKPSLPTDVGLLRLLSLSSYVALFSRLVFVFWCVYVVHLAVMALLLHPAE